jgi:N-acetyl-gamma-glutamyl-phosphate reductase
MNRSIIFGITGYTGIELLRLLTAHPEVTVIGGASRRWAGKRLSEALPFVSPKEDFAVSAPEDLVKDPRAETAFLALPHGESAVMAGPLLDAGLRVVDLSADCRLRDAEVYGKWYVPHPDPGLLERAVYGLPELYRTRLRTTMLTANPGCYPTTVILALAPLMRRKDVRVDTVVADSKSGVSGAGRGAKLNTSFCETGEGFCPYGVLGHRHTPEMEQELSLLAGRPVRVRFTPHLVPVSRGMVSTVYVEFNGADTDEDLREDYRAFYAKEPFVRILPAGRFPHTAHVRGTNACLISLEVDRRTGHIIVMSAIDNLGKGASGAAVQNMNVMLGLEETLGLETSPVFP